MFLNRWTFLLTVSAVFTLGGCTEEAAGPPRPPTDPAKLTVVFQKQADAAEVEANAKNVTRFLAGELGIEVDRKIPLTYAFAVQALIDGSCHLAYLDSYAFLKARREGQVELILAEVRTDAQGRQRTDYDSIMVVRKDSPLKTIDDLKARADKLTFCFTSRSSTSGYLMAMRRFVQEGLLQPGQAPEEVFKTITVGNGYDNAIQEVLEGRADACAVSFYALEGPRADKYTSEVERAELRVLARTGGVPTHLICVQKNLSNELKQNIKAAFLKLSNRHSEWLADVYGAKKLREVDEDEHVVGTIEALEAIGKNADDFIK